MKVDVKELPGSKRELKVEVPAEGFQEDIEAAYKEYQGTIRVPGFRKGKVPLRLVRTRFGKAIQQSVLGKIIPNFYEEALTAERLVPVSEPEIAVEEYEEGQPLVFTVTLEVSPSLVVTGYEGMEVVRTVYEVGEEDVEKQIQRLRQRHAEEHSVERPAQMGDFLLTDVQELDSSLVPLIGQKTENVVIELGGEHSPGADFDEQLVGVSAGEERRARLDYGKDYPDPRRAGQTRWMSVSVKEVKERILPTLDDEFAKDLEYESLDDLRKKAHESLEAQMSYLSEQGVRAEMLRRLIAANPFEAPGSMIERYIGKSSAEDAGAERTPEQEAEMRNKRRDQAVENIKSYIILRSIAETEGIEVSDEDVDQRVKELAEANNVGVNELRRSLRKDSELEKMKGTLLEEKVWELLMQRVQIKDAPPVRLWVSREDSEAAEGEAL